MTGVENVLGRIVANTRAKVADRRRLVPLSQLVTSAPTPGERRPFARALAHSDRINVIAEFKRRSPSRGVIRDDLDPVGVAQAYEVAGAAALSVLTEEDFFGGSLDDLQQARSATLLPTLRKDFVVDPYQVWEARIAGADAVLLIAAVLSDLELRTLGNVAAEAGIDALVEVHDQEELIRALALGASLVGVNNRNLRTMEVGLSTSLQLAPHIPDEVVAVAESGIRTGEDVRQLRGAGFDAFLVGEHLMQSPEPGAALEALITEASKGA